MPLQSAKVLEIDLPFLRMHHKYESRFSIMIFGLYGFIAVILFNKNKCDSDLLYKFFLMID